VCRGETRHNAIYWHNQLLANVNASPNSISPPKIGIRKLKRTHPSPHQPWRDHDVNEIIAAVAKAVLVTLVSTLAAIAVEEIHRYNEDRNENGYYQPQHDEYERW